jgi:superfamily II DNA or RNA helicase
MSFKKMSDRLYQNIWKQEIYNHWADGHQNVLGVMPTGGGKSHTVGEIVQEHQGVVAVIAHRQELVGQLSMTLARQGVTHNVIAPASVIKFNMAEQFRELNRSFIRTSCRDVAVVGVDTLLRRQAANADFLKRVSLWVTDECHHLLRGNKWGKAVALMPQANGLGVTATPCRADKQGLGRHAQGVMDVMVQGPTMRDLINAGFLTDYRIFAPPSDVNYSQVSVGSTGDYVQQQLRTAVKESHLVGDVVQHYQRIASGKQGVVFATDVATSGEIVERFIAAGIPAASISAKTPDAERSETMRQFRARAIRILVNVDILGEGVDCPAIEVVMMARRTLSYSLYSQQFGRALRPLEGKQDAIIIDHAGNVALHGLPDKEREWSLDGKAPGYKDRDDEIPLRYCVECTQPYEMTNKCCPWCGHYPVPADRSRPEYVDGDLHELSPEALQLLRGQVAKVDEDPYVVAERMRRAGAPEVAWRSMIKKALARRDMQAALRESIGWFAHIQDQKGRSRSDAYRRFYVLFGIDVMSAQALGRPEAQDLAMKINDYIGRSA